jgi:hypothetical protein
MPTFEVWYAHLEVWNAYLWVLECVENWDSHWSGTVH